MANPESIARQAKKIDQLVETLKVFTSALFTGRIVMTFDLRQGGISQVHLETICEIKEDSRIRLNHQHINQIVSEIGDERTPWKAPDVIK